MQTQDIKILKSIKKQNRKGIKKHFLSGFFRFFQSFNYTICIAGALRLHCRCIENALEVHSSLSVNALKVGIRCFKNKYNEVSGILNGLIHKFAIFLGRQPP
jgi:hypothetical protein